MFHQNGQFSMMHIIILYFEFIYMFEPTINTNLTTFFKQQFMDVIALAVNVIIIWFILDSAKVDIF